MILTNLIIESYFVIPINSIFHLAMKMY